jgi:hypothetical protein
MRGEAILWLIIVVAIVVYPLTLGQPSPLSRVWRWLRRRGD